VYINGKQLPEKYLPAGVITSAFEARTIPPDHYWVMGDNRVNSKDSRSFGFITKNQIVGRVFFRIWPLTRIKIM